MSSLLVNSFMIRAKFLPVLAQRYQASQKEVSGSGNILLIYFFFFTCLPRAAGCSEVSLAVGTVVSSSEGCMNFV